MRRRRHTLAAAAAASLLVVLLLPVMMLLRPTSTLRTVANGANKTSKGTGSPRRARPAPTPASPEQLAAPWMAPSDVVFPYEGLHNYLKRLLDAQSSESRITLTMFTVAQTPLLLNCVYSLVKYGEVPGYIVATVDQESLAECQRLRLPCYNASAAIGRAFDGYDFDGQDGNAAKAEYDFGSHRYRALMFAKPAIVHSVFRLGPSLLHYTDVDVAYIRAVWPSYTGLMTRAGDADVVFMNEDQALNGGNFVLRHNKATAAMVKRWAFADDAERDEHLGDQELLWTLRGGPFEVCDDKKSCRQVRKSGRAAMVLHPAQFNVVSWTGHCPGYIDWPACAPYTLYIHIICHSGLEQKIHWFKHYRLWLLEDDNFTPVTQRHEYLPCADPVAWKTSGLRGEKPQKLDPRDEQYVFLASLKEGDDE